MGLRMSQGLGLNFHKNLGKQPNLWKHMTVSEPFELKIYFPDGDPHGIQSITKVHWVGQAVFFPREQWEKAKKTLLGYLKELNPLLDHVSTS